MSDIIDLPSFEGIADSAPDSVLARFQRRAAKLRGGQLLDLDIPGHAGEVVIRMRTITDPEESRRESNALVRATQESATAENNAAAVLICKYTADVCGVQTDGRYISIDGNDEPLTFGDFPRWAVLLGCSEEDFTSVKDVLLRVVTLERRMVLTGMAQRYIAWVLGMDEGARKTLEGESRATPQ